MPAISSGRIVKAQRGKKPPGQQHQKNHRWESFSSKIAKLHSLDPLRRVRRHDLDEATAGDVSVTTSYFRNGLEKWSDLNLSRIFTGFRRAVQPLSESLPQILHFEARIMDELTKSIREAQTLDDERDALEPLLDLLTAFAHDLGTRFVARGYNARAFVLLVGVARHNSGAGIARSHHQQNHVLDAAVIEWTFAALAFLFKYLARLLVPDLRPTYDILAPLLGAQAEEEEEKKDEEEESTEQAEKAEEAEEAKETDEADEAETTEKTEKAESSEKAEKFPARVPGHIARFAAEAMSFLVKKASTPSHRETALPLIIEHARNGLLRAVEAAQRQNKHRNSKSGPQLYMQGLMTLFAESIKGSGTSLHSSGPELFVALVRAIPADELSAEPQGSTWSDVCCGVLTSIVHHSSPEALQLVVDAILAEGSAAAAAGGSPWRLSIYVRLVGVIAGVRRGSKLESWTELVQFLAKTLETMVATSSSSSSDDDDEKAVWPTEASLVWRHVVVNVAIVWSQATVDALIPWVASLTQVMSRERLSRWFIPLCAYVVELNVGRFRELLQKPFQRFIMGRWADGGNEDVLCAVLPVMVGRGGFQMPRAASSSSSNSGCLSLPQSWQDQIVSRFEQLEITPFPERGAYDKDPDTWRDRCLPKYAALLDVLDVTVAHPSTLARIAELLLRKLRLALRPTGTTTAETAFIVSQGFRSYLRMTAALAATPDPGLWPLLRAAAPRFVRRPGFLEALLQYEESLGSQESEASQESDDSGDTEDPFVQALVDNLSSTSHRLRLVSLLILQRLLRAEGQEGENANLQNEYQRHVTTLDSMLQIEQIPFGPHNARNMAVHLRKLALAYGRVADKTWLQAALPAFLFGMLSVPLAPVWDDAVEAMKQVAQANRAGEEAVAQHALAWLDVGSGPRAGSPSGLYGSSNPSEQRLPATDFDCFHVARLLAVAADTEEVVTEPSTRLRQSFEESQAAVAAYGGMERGKALKVLAAMPSLAEKRSRRLVPHLLSWTEEREDVEEEEEVEEGEEEVEAGKDVDEDINMEDVDTEHTDSDNSWSFSDKKALVVVFSLFANGQALFQSERAYAALLKLMANGDGDVQRLALKALLSWRQAGLTRHRESLEALLDEARFKNELTLLLQGDGEDGRRIQPEDRPVLMPVLLRLLYGRAIAKKGAASGRQGLHATRLFVIRSLDVASLGGFLQVALGSLQHVRVLEASGALRASLFDRVGDDSLVPARKQVGVLNMLESIIHELGTNATPHMDALVNATLYCLFSASRGLGTDQADTTSSPDTSLRRVAKTTALRCLCALFRNGGAFDWTPYRTVIVAEVISPVIGRLPQETTQGVSWTWRLLGTWAEMPRWTLFLAEDAQIVPKMLESLSMDRAKDAVKLYALGVVRSLVGEEEERVEGEEREGEQEDEDKATRRSILSTLVEPNLDMALDQLDHVMRRTSATTGAEISRPLLEACVDTVVLLSALVQTSTRVRSLVDIATWLLNQPSRRVSPRVKGALLRLLERFIRLDGLGEQADLRDRVFGTIASLFSFFRDRENRLALCRVLSVFAEGRGSSSSDEKEEDLRPVAALCFGFNAYVEGRVDEPDYDRRLAAFGAVVRAEPALSRNQWRPVLHNLLFFLRRDEEFGILSSNAADGIGRFVRDATQPQTHQPRDAAYEDLLKSVLLPAIYGGARDPSETVRREVARVFGELIATLRSWGPVSQLAVLVEDEKEDEARTRTRQFRRRRLSRRSTSTSTCLKRPTAGRSSPIFSARSWPSRCRRCRCSRAPAGAMDSAAVHVSQFFIPLLEQFIFGREDGADDHGLGAQATTTIGQLVQGLEWGQYRAVLRRFLSFVESKPELQKQVVRLLDRVVDAFTPGLIAHLHAKDEETVSGRVPVGVVVVKLLSLLPRASRDQRLAGVLTDICHILRSKSWESREMARTTLTRIAVILGPESFGFVIQELRGALTRGYQLHVLSYTLHSLLLAMLPTCSPGALDYCAETAVAVVMDDVFGVAGQEKDAEEYTSKMKEVRSSKSQDSMELLARTTSIGRLSVLVAPLRALLLERVDLTMARKIDTLLGRIASGLVQNEAAASRETLVFCWEVVQEVYRADDKTGERDARDRKMDPRTKRFLFQKSTRNNVGGRQASRFTHKLVRFALDVLRSVLRKFDSLRTAENVAGLVPLLGDAVMDGAAEEVQTAALRLLVVLVRLPFPAGTPEAAAFSGLYRVATREAIRTVSTATSTGGEHAQAALKLVAAVLRDRPDVPVRDAAVDGLLTRLRDDLTEPLYRHVTFSFLRAVLTRRVETATVYDTLDHVGTVMVTNDDRDTRDLARGAFLQFVREYPQRRARWQAQLDFVVANLQYGREGGRLSVMDAVLLLLNKTDADEHVQQIVAACFAPLVVLLANDESPRCRAAAAALLRVLLRRASRENTNRFRGLFGAWLQADAAVKPAVLRLGLQAYGIYFSSWDALADGGSGLVDARADDVHAALSRITDVLGEATQDDETTLVAAALQTVQTLLDMAPARTLDPQNKTLWHHVQQCLWFRQGTVRLAAMRLIAQYLADFRRLQPAGLADGEKNAATGSYGLVLADDDVTHMVLGCLSVLSGRSGLGVDEAEAEEAARMLPLLPPALRPVLPKLNVAVLAQRPALDQLPTLPHNLLQRPRPAKEPEVVGDDVPVAT
ncbi:heat repeat protein [Grosmannia clavigera kw1407]|uniref:Heat repeat protein n=1 Tax=Grosmannia clavigera (strain kw1407 / UAMH 11150) TaxID=655863 RepID=F0XS12_GROCL|nr:heat repeat protein [Grosmannia clavigera kw1407]EFW99566.1 heat repeat protein [Grosmannia clavigera kw1407]